MKENTSENNASENSTLCTTKVLQKHFMNSLNIAFSKMSASSGTKSFLSLFKGKTLNFHILNTRKSDRINTSENRRAALESELMSPSSSTGMHFLQAFHCMYSSRIHFESLRIQLREN